MIDSKTTLVLGASLDPSRYSYLAANRLATKGHKLVLVGRSSGLLGGTTIQTNTDGIANIHTVSIYLNRYNQAAYQQFILTLKPTRVIFNPGAENPDFMKTLQNQGIEAFEACTLVLLSTGQF